MLHPFKCRTHTHVYCLFKHVIHLFFQISGSVQNLSSSIAYIEVVAVLQGSTPVSVCLFNSLFVFFAPLNMPKFHLSTCFATRNASESFHGASILLVHEVKEYEID